MGCEYKNNQYWNHLIIKKLEKSETFRLQRTANKESKRESGVFGGR